MDASEREVLGRIIRGGRWAALATYGDGMPLFGFEDFLLFRLVPREARFVAGFARAYTVSVEELKEAASIRLGS